MEAGSPNSLPFHYEIGDLTTPKSFLELVCPTNACFSFHNLLLIFVHFHCQSFLKEGPLIGAGVWKRIESFKS